MAKLWLVVFLFCFVIESSQEPKKVTQRTQRKSKTENRTPKQKGTPAELKSVIVSKNKQKKDKSNAYNFIDAASQVNIRTGSLSFSITIGHIVTHTRRFQVKLMYSQELALAGKHHGFGLGWTLNFPWISKGVSLYMGDGSSYTILPTGDFRYYDARNINITCIGETICTYAVKHDGDTWFISRGKTRKLETREEYMLRFERRLQHLTVFNETDPVLRMRTNSFHDIVITTYTSMGLVRYKLLMSKLGNFLEKIICLSCNHRKYYQFFRRKQKPYMLIKQITYPSGLTEKFRYTNIGSVGPIAWGVSKMVQDPGSHILLLDKKATIPSKVTDYDYDPFGTGHDFRGSNFARPRCCGKDRLLEMDGTYEYHTKKEIEDTCMVYTFNKMHLKTNVVLRACNKPNVPLQETLYNYPCVSNLSYKKMKKTCPTGVAYYTKPIQIFLRILGKSGNYYSETTHHKYNDYGRITETTLNNGEVKLTEYKQETKTKNGEFLLPSYKIHRPTTYCLIWNYCTYPAIRIDFWYKNIAKFNQSKEYYKVEVVTNQSFIHPQTGEQIPIRDTVKSYYEDKNDMHSYGRLKSYLLKSADNDEQIYFEYKYVVADGKFTTTTITNRKEVWTKIVDMATNLELTKIKSDHSQVIQFYDIEGRIRAKIIKSNLTNDPYIVTKYEYAVGRDQNTINIGYPDKRIKRIKFDNANNVLEKDIQKGGKYFFISSNTYNSKWEVEEQQSHYTKKRVSNIMTIKYKYDHLGRMTEKQKPDGVAEFWEYDAFRDGMVTLKYMQIGSNKTIPECTVANISKITRKGQLLNDWYNKTNPCSIDDCLSVEITPYDGFQRVATKQKLGYQNKTQQALEETVYDRKGFLKSQTTKLNRDVFLNVHYTTSVIFNRMTEIWVKKIDRKIEMARRVLNNFGRVKTETYEGVQSKNFYNDKGQLIEEHNGRKGKIIHKYDGFGRMNESTGTVEGDINAKIFISTTFNPSGKLNSTSIIQGNDKDILHRKQFDYDTTLGLVNLYTFYAEKKKPTTRKTVNKFLVDTYDEVWKKVKEIDYEGNRYSYNFNKKRQLADVKISTKDLTIVVRYKISYFYNIFGIQDGYKFYDQKTFKGYTTNFTFDKYQRVQEIKYEQLYPKKLIGKISYQYDEFYQIIEKNLNGQTNETFDYDPAGRIRKYQCKQLIKKPLWSCPKFTDGINPSKKESYLVLQNFFYNIFSNIIRTESASNANEHVKMYYLYKYEENTPTKLHKTVYERENMVEIPKSVIQRYIYDDRGNIRKIITETKEDYVLKYDALGRTYWKTYMEIITYHDEKGLMYYYMIKNGTEINEKWIMNDDTGKMRSELHYNGERNTNTYLYMDKKKVASL